MSIENYLQAAPVRALSVYDDKEERKKDAVSYMGSCRRHPYDKNKILIIVHPMDRDMCFYEFKKEDIAVIEELTSTVDDNGVAINQNRIWVTKGSIGLRYEAFEVQAEPVPLKDSNQIARAVHGKKR